MNRRVIPWVIFLSSLTVLIFSSTFLAKTVDWLLWPIRFGLIAGLSLVFLWSRWRHRNDGPADKMATHKDSADQFLSSVRRWYTATRTPQNDLVTLTKRDSRKSSY
jgi:ABC-type nickel/cobalt efflux system permease component RcnA